MECNKDEAARAKEIAEKKFSAKDLVGAKKFALKAQTLYPGLEGISQMVATLDVYISAEHKIIGEADWYGILGVNPRADEETLRKEYRKLALMLHPDKNKSIGAEGAFKVISEAWSLLSDKAKRLAYDQKRNVKGSQQRVRPPNGGPAAPPAQNGFYNFTKPTTSNAKVPKGNTTKVGATSIPKQERPTFWTVCHQCRMQYEYQRMYLNHNLLCPNCHEAFFAEETPPPTSNKVSTNRNYSQQQQKSNHQGVGKNISNAGTNNSTPPNVGPRGHSGQDSSNHTNFQWGPFSRTTDAASAAQAATMVQQAYEKVKREREEAQKTTKKEEALRRKNQAKKAGGVSLFGNSNAVKRKRGIEDLGANNSGRDTMNQTGMGTGVARTAGLSSNQQGSFERGKVTGPSKPGSTKDVSSVEIKNLLMDKARKEIRKKLNEWSSTTAVKSTVKGEEIVNEKEKENSVVNGATLDHKKSRETIDTRNGIPASLCVPGTSDSNPDKKPIELISINVPDPDFHDFDRDRTEGCFGENQVWAAYDGDDGMPRYYAMIHNVISLTPFKVKISWLNSKTNSELGPINWLGSGFSKTCGDFKIGKHEINTSLNSFSHKVRWTKGTRGAVQIFPKKGDVWALYRNWSPEWNELTADEVIHMYGMVEVLEDYEEELGVTVAPLVKVAGFKTVFHRHLDPREVKRIPREEMFRFSHQVPSYLHTGQEAPKAPKGCRELDPAATPLELLHIIPVVMENEEGVMVENIVGIVGKAINEEKASKYREESTETRRMEESMLKDSIGLSS